MDLRPEAKLVVNEAQPSQRAARKDHAVDLGAPSVTTGPSGVTAVRWSPRDGSPPVVLSAAPTQITGVITGGSESVLIGD